MRFFLVPLREPAEAVLKEASDKEGKFPEDRGEDGSGGSGGRDGGGSPGANTGGFTPERRPETF
ncbi:hypothetical protein F2Q68_00022816 [Brassica cretica]|uniref:Uncharacterized protein n=1 Tax=Brassica cretica TaxID=69181 RepID=A0A8S9FUP4_BRACR|nr:hypothetical protein F2Q68_00022816 [Brassica cretica]